MVAALNKVRAKHGARRLHVSASLRRSSRRYAVWMLKHDYFGHRRHIGVPRRFRSAGEALAIHDGWRPRWRLVVRAWMRSRPHRRLLLDRRFRWIGVSFARGRMGRARATTWVAHLGSL